MKYYKYLYLDENLEKKKDKVIEKLEKNKFQRNIYLLLLPGTGKNNLEIINSALLLQPDYPKEELVVAGIAQSYEDALDLVEKILKEVYDKTNGAGIREYLLKKEQED